MNTPKSASICPQCGATSPAIMDIEQTLPILDPITGYPQFYCRRCAAIFSALTPPSAPCENESDDKNKNRK